MVLTAASVCILRILLPGDVAAATVEFFPPPANTEPTAANRIKAADTILLDAFILYLLGFLILIHDF
jgi:hypothetical protein